MLPMHACCLAAIQLHIQHDQAYMQTSMHMRGTSACMQPNIVNNDTCTSTDVRSELRAVGVHS
jgi:hypothetical protein